MEIEVGDKITIEGLNISPDGVMHFNKPKKTGREKEAPVLVVVSSSKFVEKSVSKVAIDYASRGEVSGFLDKCDRKVFLDEGLKGDQVSDEEG